MLLGIIVAVVSEVERVARYAKAAQEAGHEVRVFVTFEAVQTLSQPIWEEITENAAVIACAQTVHFYQVKVAPRITLGSQFDHAELAQQSDRFLALV
jgi:D-serine deaminase-like pyridoxal phosphate-dependent protein